jgi:hypothetical protein
MIKTTQSKDQDPVEEQDQVRAFPSLKSGRSFMTFPEGWFLDV